MLILPATYQCCKTFFWSLTCLPLLRLPSLSKMQLHSMWNCGCFCDRMSFASHMLPMYFFLQSVNSLLVICTRGLCHLLLAAAWCAVTLHTATGQLTHVGFHSTGWCWGVFDILGMCLARHLSLHCAGDACCLAPLTHALPPFDRWFTGTHDGNA